MLENANVNTEQPERWGRILSFSTGYGPVFSADGVVGCAPSAALGVAWRRTNPRKSSCSSLVGKTELDRTRKTMDL